MAKLKPGSPAPDFELPNADGKNLTLANFKGKQLVLFFYPRADTPGCTLEAKAFSALQRQFAKADTAVVGVSADPVKKQDAFRVKHDLKTPLLSDEKLKTLKAFGVWGEKTLYGRKFMGIIRTTVLIDKHGKIAQVWPTVRVAGHAEEVLEAAKELRGL
jgi:peroxiredoxin Q/BCP